MRLTIISMPWAIFNRPSIQLGALKSFVQSRSSRIETRALHPYLEVASTIGLDNYRLISEDNWAGEALYSALLFPEQRDKARQLFKSSLGRHTSDRLPDFDQLTSQLDKQLNDWLRRLEPAQSDLIGFSVCFSQLIPSLLAASRIKKQAPPVPIVLGGSTCAPRIGASLLDTFRQIDFVITGEGELSLLNLCSHLMDGENPGPGVLYRQGAVVRPSGAEHNEISDLNELPPPDYSDYFNELRTQRLSFIPVLPLEFSRGCWWNKCAFCNLNLQWRGYRYKSGERMIKETEFLQKRHQCLDFTFTDNALPPREADRFFANMAQSGNDRRFFAEIRTLTKPETYRLYRRGGLQNIQVGIEALSDSLLARMNKGTRAIDNIAAMKFAMAAGMELDGNLILEFPGSTEEEVAETLRVLDLVLPFRPLKTAGFFLGHGSPVHCRPDQYDITALTTHPHNRKLFPDSISSHLELLINSYRGDRTRQARLWRPVRAKMKAWADFHAQKNKNTPALSYRQGDGFLIIRQERPGAATLHHRLQGLSMRIYLACEQITARKELLRIFKSIKKEQLFTFLDELENKKLLFQDNDSCLALAFQQTATRRE